MMNDGLLDNDAFTKGVREDGTVEGYSIETYYRPCKGIGNDAGFLRVLVDDNATDIETRVPYSALVASGWKPPGSCVTGVPPYYRREWPGFVRSLYIAARGSSFLGGVPSDVLEAMKDILLAAENSLCESDGEITAPASPSPSSPRPE